jgi:CHAT domain
MPSWVAVVATFALSLILAYWFLLLRCRGIGRPFGPRARYWAFFIVVGTAILSSVVGLLLVVVGNHVPAYAALVVPGGLWLSKLPPQRDRDLHPRTLPAVLTLPFSRLYDRMGDDMEDWCATRLRAVSPNPQWIADAAQYYSNQVEGLRPESPARANLDRWRDSIKHKISIVRLINLEADPERLRAALHLHPSTQHLRKYEDDDLARLADRLETEALNELRLLLAYIYRLGYHTRLIYPFRPSAARVQSPPLQPARLDPAGLQSAIGVQVSELIVRDGERSSGPAADTSGGAGRGMPDQMERHSSGPAEPSLGSGSGGAGGRGPEAPHEPPADRFLTGILPERTPLDARLSLLVRITLAGVRGSSAVMKAFPVSPAGTSVTITVSAPGLRSLGDLEQDLTVPFAADSEPVRFGFRADRVGLHTVEIRAFAGGTCLGELALQISVETGAAVEEGRPRTAPMAGLAAEPGEVTLQVSRTSGGGYSFQLLSEALYPVVLIDRLAGDPARVVQKIVAELRLMSKGQSPYSTAAHARNRLRALGTELWADVVPEAIRGQFWAQRDRIKLFTIASDMDTVPWELVYPVDLENEDGFLVEQFPVVRRVYGQGRARVLRLQGGAGFIVPPRPPDDALDEVASVRGILPANVANRGVEAGLTEVLELLAAVPSVLHFAGHSAFTEEDGSVITLNGGPLRPDDLSYARQKRAFAAVSPLVFLNGCRTAGEIAGFAQMNGWAEKFMGAGAGAFIGSLWAVRSSSAKVFAEEFYRELVSRQQPLGIASLRARQAIAADSGDPTWLAYTVYGNPSACVEHYPSQLP